MSETPVTPREDFGPHLRRAVADLGGSLTGLVPLAGDGSDRRFYRLPLPGGSLVLLHQPRPPGGAVTEFDSYRLIGTHLRRCGLPVPEIFGHCREEGWFLLEDLGDVSLQEAVTGAAAETVGQYYSRALELLVRLQVEGSPGFSPAWCFDTPNYDAALVRQRECHYFTTAFLRGVAGLVITAAELEADFDRLIAGALASGASGLLHRDFQSRNLMVQGGRLRLIDFQGARWGPPQYDLAALLIDPYVNLPAAAQESCIREYRELLPAAWAPGAGWRERYDHLALCRNLQILGAYGFLSRVKGKAQFEQYMAPALAGLRRRLAQGPGRSLSRLCRAVEAAAERLGQQDFRPERPSSR